MLQRVICCVYGDVLYEDDISSYIDQFFQHDSVCYMDVKYLSFLSLNVSKICCGLV